MRDADLLLIVVLVVFIALGVCLLWPDDLDNGEPR